MWRGETVGDPWVENLTVHFLYCNISKCSQPAPKFADPNQFLEEHAEVAENWLEPSAFLPCALCVFL